MKYLTLLVLLILIGCGASIGAFDSLDGPHPHINVAGEIRAGPISILHSPVPNADPVTDLTVATLQGGPRLGPLQPIIGVGWQLGRMWGQCDAEGFNCEMTYSNGYAVSAGLTYRQSPFRADFRAYAFDNSPVGASSQFPLGIEALVLLFGFDL